MKTANFSRTIEDFICENCGREVVGDGYTNHCPECLWSKHVDVNPGDRAEGCRGMMKPCGKEKKGDKWVVSHKCIRCNFKRKGTIRNEDNFDELLKI